jgi:integral membrane protein
MFKFDTTYNRLRAAGILEAISFLILLGIAMPLKYIWGHPEMVQIVGMAHGILWIIYVSLACLGQLDYKWSWKTTALLFIASLLPFGPIIADAKLLRKFAKA